MNLWCLVDMVALPKKLGRIGASPQVWDMQRWFHLPGSFQIYRWAIPTKIEISAICICRCYFFAFHHFFSKHSCEVWSAREKADSSSNWSNISISRLLLPAYKPCSFISFQPSFFPICTKHHCSSSVTSHPRMLENQGTSVSQGSSADLWGGLSWLSHPLQNTKED